MVKLKSTGIVRKVDELGRIVLPIELRRTVGYAIQGSVLFIALFICAINLVVDIVYAFIDPRIKAQYKGGGKKKNRHQEKEKGKVS